MASERRPDDTALHFVLDVHLDPKAISEELPVAPITQAARHLPRIAYTGEQRNDEDRNHILQLAFERNATLLSTDIEGMLDKAYGFGPCHSKKHRLGGVIILPPRRKEKQIAALRSFKDGSLHVLDLDPGDFETIWRDNVGIDLTKKAPKAVELCDCAYQDDKDARDRRFKRK